MAEFRTANPEDVSLIQDLAKQVWDFAYTPVLSAVQIQYMLEFSYNTPRISDQISSPDYDYFILEENGSPIGFVGLDVNEGKGKLDKLYILPGTQKKGLGRFSVHFVKDFFKQKGYSQLYLHVNRYNPSVIFYLRCGFRIDRVYDYPFGSAFWMNDYIMITDL